MNCYLISKRKRFVSTLFIVCLAFWQCGEAKKHKVREEKPKIVTRPFDVDVLFENSLSNEGYLGTGSEMKSYLQSIISDLNNASFCRNLNLGYVDSGNKTIVNQNANDAQIMPYIQSLKSSIKSNASDLNQILSLSIKGSNKDKVTILVSDCIFSNADKNIQTIDFLPSQQIGIKSLVSAELKRNPNLSIMIMQVESKFKGAYYTSLFDPQSDFHQHVQLNCKRPIYFWFIGKKDNIAQLLNNGMFQSAEQYGYKNSAAFENNTLAPAYAIAAPKQEMFKKKTNTTLEEAEMKVDRRTGEKYFEFSILLNLKNAAKGSKYYLDAHNYSFNNNYKLTASKIIDAKYTHKLTFKTAQLKEEQFKLEFKNNLPLWVETLSSESDAQIETSSLEQQKTFGLKYLINGVQEAYSQNSKSIPITLNIEK